MMLVASIILNVNGQSKTYFISQKGNDDQNGLSLQTAWRTIGKVNQVVFQPGDHILFESGGLWNGQLKPQGSGEPGNPIILSSYGGRVKPVINLGRAEGAGIRLTNQSWWEISNMEVTSGAAPEIGIGRQGIVAIIKGDEQHVEHIVVRDCYIHDIWGQLGGNTEFSGYNSCAILVKVMYERNRDRNKPMTCTLNDVQIEKNKIERFDKCGIIIGGGKNNIVVRKNIMDNLGGDGIFVSGCDKGIIEYNIVRRSCMRSGYLDLPGSKGWWPHTAAIWIARANETIMQFNEVYDTGREPGNGDGEAYDFDFGCKRCILQYNYSKNNHGLLLIMYDTFENIARYNISENDQSHLIQLQCDTTERNIIHNNIFYVDYGTADLDFFCGDDGKKDKSKLGAKLNNNIFYATGQGRFRTVYASGEVLKRQFNDTVKLPKMPGTLFHHNCYFGPWTKGLPDDAEKMVADPMFVAPGTGGNGLASLTGYELKNGSPCINTGVFIPSNGNRDFFGNQVNDGHIDVGAFEQIGSGVFAESAVVQELNRKESARSRLAWAKTTFPKTLKTPSADGKITVMLKEPLENSLTGTLSWNNQALSAKPALIPMNKLPGRNSFEFTVKADHSSVIGSTVHVMLQEQEFKEEWDIPVSTEDNLPVR